MKELFNTSTPTEFKMVICKEVNECSKTESIIHYLLKKFRINKSREFFKIELDKVKNIFDMLEGEYIDDLKKITTDEDEYEKSESDEEGESDEEDDYEEINFKLKKGRKVYKCDMCNRFFGKKSHLQNHLNRKFKCVNPKIKIVNSSDIIF